MTIIEGQIETLKKLKASLSRSDIDRFNSIGEIRSFLRDFESEKKQLPNRVENEFDVEIQCMRSGLASHQKVYDDLVNSTRNELRQQIHELETKFRLASNKSNRSFLYKAFYYLHVKSLSRRMSRLENNLEGILKNKTRGAKNTVARLEIEIEDRLKNRAELISERFNKSLDKLNYAKKVVDGLYPLVAGAIGETAVVNALQQLSDDHYLINDFSLEFDPPIYNRKDNDRIYSIQIDHLLVCQSGIFLLETKNWSRSSIGNLDLRSPVKQIRRTSFALFVLLNSDSQDNRFKLNRHHWGAKKIPIRNLVVMINEKPREEFKHVKVLSLKELIGYIQYFDHSLDVEEVENIFEYLKNSM